MDELERALAEAVVTNLNEQSTYFTVDNEETNKKNISGYPSQI